MPTLAATEIGPIAEEILPAHDWRGIRGIGNRLRNEYDVIIDPANWVIATNRLPELREAIAVFLARYPKDKKTSRHRFLITPSTPAALSTPSPAR